MVAAIGWATCTRTCHPRKQNRMSPRSYVEKQTRISGRTPRAAGPIRPPFVTSTPTLLCSRRGWAGARTRSRPRITPRTSKRAPAAPPNDRRRSRPRNLDLDSGRGLAMTSPRPNFTAPDHSHPRTAPPHRPRRLPTPTTPQRLCSAINNKKTQDRY